MTNTNPSAEKGGERPTIRTNDINDIAVFLGRKLKKVEKQMFDLLKGDFDYFFYKDERGLLASRHAPLTHSSPRYESVEKKGGESQLDKIYKSDLWKEIEENFEFFNECIEDADVRDFYKRLIWQLVESHAPSPHSESIEEAAEKYITQIRRRIPSHIDDALIDVINGCFKDGANWQSQQTANAFKEAMERVAELEGENKVLLDYVNAMNKSLPFLIKKFMADDLTDEQAREIVEVASKGAGTLLKMAFDMCGFKTHIDAIFHFEKNNEQFRLSFKKILPIAPEGRVKG